MLSASLKWIVSVCLPFENGKLSLKFFFLSRPWCELFHPLPTCILPVQRLTSANHTTIEEIRDQLTLIITQKQNHEGNHNPTNNLRQYSTLSENNTMLSFFFSLSLKYFKVLFLLISFCEIEVAIRLYPPTYSTKITEQECERRDFFAFSLPNQHVYRVLSP